MGVSAALTSGKVLAEFICRPDAKNAVRSSGGWEFTGCRIPRLRFGLVFGERKPRIVRFGRITQGKGGGLHG